MRKSPILFALPLLLILAVSVLPVVGAQSVNVLDSDDYEKTVVAENSATFQWKVYNNNTSPYLINLNTIEDPQGQWSLRPETNYLTLYPGQVANVSFVFQAGVDVRGQTLSLPVWMNLTQLNDLSVTESFHRTITVHTKPLFESNQNMIFGMFVNNFPAPLNSFWGSFALTMIIWALIAGFVYFVANPIVHSLTSRTKTDLDDRILEVVKLPIFLLIITFGLVQSLDILNISVALQKFIHDVYNAAVVLLVGWLAYKVYNSVVIYYAEQWSKKSETELDDVLVPLLHKLGMVIIPVVILVVVLNSFHIDLTLFLAGAGVIGLVIAFATQETLGNLFAGIQILTDRPFRVGDVVELDTGEAVVVKKIGLRSTWFFHGAENEMIILPNNEVANKKVVNYSRPDNRRSINAQVGVAYGSDLEKVKAILLDIANSHPDVIKEDPQKPYVRLSKFGDSSIDFTLWYWVDEVKKMWRVGSEIRETIDRRFREEGIEIPFPQSVVTFKNSPPK